jgi:hypothetical protein
MILRSSVVNEQVDAMCGLWNPTGLSAADGQAATAPNGSAGIRLACGMR